MATSAWKSRWHYFVRRFKLFGYLGKNKFSSGPIAPRPAVAPKSKECADLELIKWSITRLLLAFNVIIIRLIVRAQKSFSCPPTLTPPLSSSSSLVLTPLLFHSPPLQLSFLIYFVSPFTFQKLFKFPHPTSPHPHPRSCFLLMKIQCRPGCIRSHKPRSQQCRCPACVDFFR